MIGCKDVNMAVNESRFSAVILFVGRPKCVVQIVFVNIGDQMVSNLLLSYNHNGFISAYPLCGSSKIYNKATVCKLRMIQGRLLKERA